MKVFICIYILYVLISKQLIVFKIYVFVMIAFSRKKRKKGNSFRQKLFSLSRCIESIPKDEK